MEASLSLTVTACSWSGGQHHKYKNTLCFSNQHTQVHRVISPSTPLPSGPKWSSACHFFKLIPPAWRLISKPWVTWCSVAAQVIFTSAYSHFYKPLNVDKLLQYNYNCIGYPTLSWIRLNARVVQTPAVKYSNIVVNNSEVFWIYRSICGVLCINCNGRGIWAGFVLSVAVTTQAWKCNTKREKITFMTTTHTHTQ